jgi:catechol 2,3-dioxygenase-like lactoylglutathione lyase family enzyme
MLGHGEVMPTVAVKSLEKAKEFYEGKLGLRPAPGHENGAVVYRNGGSSILVYESSYAGTNKATAVTWVMGEDEERVVQELKNKGITFEHYDMPGMTREGDLHVAGKMKAAWFKDPDGNIHALVSR